MGRKNGYKFKLRDSLDRNYSKNTVSKNIKYQKTGNSGKIGKTIDAINHDQYTLVENVRSLIKQLHENQRSNDQSNYAIVSERLNKIVSELFRTATITDAQKNSLKSKIVQILYTQHISKEQRDSIVGIIEDELNKLEQDASKGNSSEHSDQIDSFLDETIEIDAEKTSQIYRKVLSNETVIRQISETISNSLLNTHLVEDKKKIRKYIDNFKRNNKNLFTLSNNALARKSSFATLLKHGNRLNVFLIKYNRVIYSKFIREMQNVKRLRSMDEMRSKLMPRYVASQIRKNTQKWLKSKTKFVKIFKPSYWKKLWKDKVQKQFMNFLRFGRMRSAVQTTLTAASGSILFVGNILFSTFKIGLGITKSIFSLTTKVIGGTITILKGILSTSLRIAKNVISSGYHLLNRVKLFLFSPVGVYLTGFIIGFFKEKIIEKYKQFVDFVKEKTKDIKDWISEKNKTWFQKNKDDEKESNGEQNKTIFYYIKEYFLKVSKKFKQYMDIFSSKQNEGKTMTERLNEFKKLLNEDTGYADTILRIEDTIDEINKDSFMEKWNQLYSSLEQFIDNSEVVRAINTLLSLNGTGVASRMAASAGISQVAKRASQIAGIAIGTALGGPLGALIGGSLGAIVGSLAESLIQFGFSKMTYSSKEKNVQLQVLRDQDEKLVSDDRNKAFAIANKKRKTLENEIENLKKQSGNEDLLEKKQSQLNEINSQISVLYDIRDSESGEAKKIVEGMSDSMVELQLYAGMDKEQHLKIIDAITSKDKENSKKLMDEMVAEYNDIEKQKKIKPKDMDPDIKKFLDVVAGCTKQIMIRYADDYDRGYISEEEFKKRVLNDHRKLMEMKLPQSDMTIGYAISHISLKDVVNTIRNGYVSGSMQAGIAGNPGIGASQQIRDSYSNFIQNEFDRQNTKVSNLYFDRKLLRFMKKHGEDSTLIKTHRTDFRKLYNTVRSRNKGLKEDKIDEQIFKCWEYLRRSYRDKEDYLNPIENQEMIKKQGLFSYADIFKNVNGILLPDTKSEDTKMMIQLMQAEDGYTNISGDIMKYDSIQKKHQDSSNMLDYAVKLNKEIMDLYGKEQQIAILNMSNNRKTDGTDNSEGNVQDE